MADPTKEFDKVNIPKAELKDALLQSILKLEMVKMMVGMVTAAGGPAPTKDETKEMIDEALGGVYKLLNSYGIEITEGAVQ